VASTVPIVMKLRSA